MITVTERCQRKQRAALQPTRIRVLVVDGHEMVRSSLSLFLEIMDGMELVGEAASGKEAVDLCGQLQPNVVLMGLHLPDMSGIDITRILRTTYPRLGVIMLTTSAAEADIRAAYDAGVSGYLIKDIGIDALATAIYAGMSKSPARIG
jgi:DNA-binding NarL/FixJ family response regulator